MVVGERGLRASLMRALRAVAKATLSRFARLEPPAEVLILINRRRKKTCFKSRFFEWWSAREDSNLRPTGPKPVALPSCATRRCGAHLTAGGYRRQSLFFPCISSGDKSAIIRCAGGCAAYFTQALAGFSASVCARRNGSRNSADRQAAMEITTKKPFQCQISITRAIG